MLSGTLQSVHFVVLLSTHSFDPCLCVCGGGSDHPAIDPLASFPPSGQQLHHSSGVFHKSRGDNLVRMWAQLKIWCVSFSWVLQRGIVVMGVIWRRLCVSMIRGREICLFCIGQGDCFVLSRQTIMYVWSPRRVIRSAESYLLTVPPGKPDKYGSRSIVMASANLCNSLRGERAAWIKNSPTVESFKINLKMYLFYERFLSKAVLLCLLMYIIVLCFFHCMFLYVYYMGLLKPFRV